MIHAEDIKQKEEELDKMRAEYRAQMRADNPNEFAEWAVARALEKADVAAIAAEHDRIIKLRYAEYERSLAEKEDEHQELHRYVDSLEKELVAAGVNVHLVHNDDGESWRVELPKRELIPHKSAIKAALKAADDAWFKDRNDTRRRDVMIVDFIADLFRTYAAPAPVADIDAKAREYAEKAVSPFTACVGATVRMGLPFDRVSVGVPFGEQGLDLNWVRNAVAKMLADFYRQQTGGK